MTLEAQVHNLEKRVQELERERNKYFAKYCNDIKSLREELLMLLNTKQDKEVIYRTRPDMTDEM